VNKQRGNIAPPATACRQPRCRVQKARDEMGKHHPITQ